MEEGRSCYPWPEGKSRKESILITTMDALSSVSEMISVSEQLERSLIVCVPCASSDGCAIPVHGVKNLEGALVVP